MLTLLLAIVGCPVGKESPGTYFGASAAVVRKADHAMPWAVAVGAPGSLNMPGTVWLLPAEGGQPIWRSDGLLPGSRFGFSIEATGDLDGDGVTDLVVGSPEEDGRGAAHVVSGHTGKKLLSVPGKSLGDRFGHSLSWVGKPGMAEDARWIVGAPQAPATSVRLDASRGAGYVRLYEGLDATVLREWSGASPGCGFGLAVEVGLAGNQTPFLAVGAPFYSLANVERVGYLHLYSLSDASPGERMIGDTPGMQFGYAIGRVGGAGGKADDLAVASSYGRFSDASPSAVSLVRLEGMEVLWKTGAGMMERALGAALASVSCWEGSGLQVRLFVSTPFGGPALCGGNPIAAGALIQLDVATGKRKGALQPIEALCQHHLGGTYGHGPLPFAAFLESAGDFDGDSRDDLLIGSPDSFGSGEVWVYSPARSRVLLRWSEGKY